MANSYIVALERVTLKLRNGRVPDSEFPPILYPRFFGIACRGIVAEPL
jgi:hypothetical protein